MSLSAILTNTFGFQGKTKLNYCMDLARKTKPTSIDLDLFPEDTLAGSYDLIGYYTFNFPDRQSISVSMCYGTITDIMNGTKYKAIQRANEDLNNDVDRIANATGAEVSISGLKSFDIIAHIQENGLQRMYPVSIH